MPHRNGAGLGFFAPYDSHIGDLLHFRIANLGLELLVAVIERSADAGGSKFRIDGFSIVRKFVAYRQNGHLHRSEPQRKSAGIMLNKDAEESFHRPPKSAMNHQRLVPAAVFTDVLQAEAPGKVEVELHRGELPGPADGVDQFDVD